MSVTLPYPNRIERLTAWLAESRLDCAVVFGADHVNHLVGYHRYFGGPAAVAVGADGSRSLVVALDEAPIARELSSADEVVPYGVRGFGLDLDPIGNLVPVVAGLDVVATSHRIGVASELPGAEERFAATAASAELASATGALAKIRMRKDADELERILAAYGLCWVAQAAVADASVAGATEIGIFSAGEAAATLAAGTPIEFVGDLLSGANAAEVCGPIRIPSRRAADAGEGVVADLVLRLNGYWGDSAWTHPVGDAPEIVAARDGLSGILKATGEQLVPRATGRDLFADMHARIMEAFPGGEFPHHGGHAVGLTSFEDPHVIPADSTPLEVGMVLAIEPGVYFPGRYGARVENIFVVTDGGGVELREAV